MSSFFGALRPAIIVIVVGTTVACGGDDATSPDPPGRTQAIVRDMPAPSITADGFVSADINVLISTDGQSWTALGSPNGITVELQSETDSTNVHGEVTAPAGSFRFVRLVMANARATVKSGSTIGSATLGDDVLLTLGGDDDVVVVEKSVSFQVVAGTLASISFELNAEQWLTELNLQDGVVDDSEIQVAATVRSRAEPSP